MTRMAVAMREPDRLIAATACVLGGAAVATTLSNAVPPAVTAGLVAAAGLLAGWAVRRLRADVREARAAWRAVLARLAEQDRQLAALALDSSGSWSDVTTPVTAAVVDALPVIAWASRSDGTPTRINPRWRAYTGATPPDGRAGVDARIHPADRPRVRAAWAKAAAAGTPYRVELRLRGAAGHYRWFLSQAEPAPDGEWVGTTTDIHRLKRAERRKRAGLTAADRRKDDLLAQIAHELRNPLAPIRTAAEALNATPGLPPDAARAAAVVGRQARHLGRLVDDLMDVTRIARGQVRLLPVRCDLRDVIGDAVEGCRPAVDARGHALAVDLPPHPLAVDGDPGRLTQVVSNLLVNAAKYTPDGGTLAVSAAADGGRAVVRVSDTGLGLPADQLARVFEPFTQLDGGRERAAGGLGIGLALVRSLVELHGGTVTAASAGPGRGSTFTVTLSLASEVEPHGPRPGLSVLVVDDHPDAADTLAALLTVLGHRAAVARDGPAGLAYIRERRPDLVLLDHQLPGLSGGEVAAAVRADPALAGVRLVSVSGGDGPTDGFDARLPKPVGVSELRQALAAVSLP